MHIILNNFRFAFCAANTAAIWSAAAANMKVCVPIYLSNPTANAMSVFINCGYYYYYCGHARDSECSCFSN